MGKIRQLIDPQPKSISLSDVEILKESGFEIINGGDAAKANSDYFLVMQRRNQEGKVDSTVILCPSYLRGPLTISPFGGCGY